MTGIWATLTSTPMSPLATIIPSLASKISLNFPIASDLSILDMINGFNPCFFSITRALKTSALVVTIDNATKSALIFAANSNALNAALSGYGCDGILPGVATPRFSVRKPPLITSHITFSFWISRTSSSIRPSSTGTESP